MDSTPLFLQDLVPQANQAKLNSDLLTAAYKGDATRVKSLIAKKADPNVMGKFGYTPLIEAAMNNQPAAIDALLNSPRTFINKSSDYGLSALMLASQKGNLRAVTALITDSNILINQSDEYGNTALIHAIFYLQVDVIERICSVLGLAINQLNEDRENALQIAIKQKHFYLKSGKQNAELGIKHESIIKILRSKGAMLPKSCLDAKYFADEWLNMDELNYQLLSAAGSGALSEVTVLLSHGAYLNAEDEYGETPLMKATQYNHLTVCEFLLQQPGILVNKPNKDRGSPLMWAARNGYNEIAFKLIERQDILVNETDWEGNSAYFLACRHNHPSIVRALLTKQGIHLNRENKERLTPIEAAFNHNNHEIVKLLETAGVILPVHLKKLGPANKRAHSAQKRSRPTLSSEAAALRSKSVDPKDTESERDYQKKRDALNTAYNSKLKRLCVTPPLIAKHPPQISSRFCVTPPLGAKHSSQISSRFCITPPLSANQLENISSSEDLPFASLTLGDSKFTKMKGMKSV